MRVDSGKGARSFKAGLLRVMYAHGIAHNSTVTRTHTGRTKQGHANSGAGPAIPRETATQRGDTLCSSTHTAIDVTND